MSEKREEQPDESRVEDLPVEPMSEEEQSNVKGGGTAIGQVINNVGKALTSAAKKE